MTMEVDLDRELMNGFKTMNTTDKDVLITEFLRVLGSQPNAAEGAFYLDMANWNLQEAVSAWMDVHHPRNNPLAMRFVQDITIGEGESVPPSTRFTKTWRIRNTGAESWPPGCTLRFTDGDQLSNHTEVTVGQVSAGQEIDISVEMCSPPDQGMFQGKWRMCNPGGNFFGDAIWVIICVEKGGVLAVTQQLNSNSFDFQHNTSAGSSGETHNNPFNMGME